MVDDPNRVRDAQFLDGGTRHREAEIDTVLDHTADATEPTLRLGMTQVPNIPDCSTAFLA